ncbi:hypothetical protein GGQ13_003036 [Salinibacter ruber]|uniref:hypothetical protein n=1 Tax=Salinibacter ruber TaxID=146919 RepID=UPI00216A6200|nr:hypothetical protein [Salinibacter ruber]MCS4139581.1 hypothetical protein [Salinibacter ruber]
MDSDDLNQNRNKETLSDLTEGSGEENEPTKRYTLDLPQSLHKWLKKQAVIEEERSMKEITIEALREYKQSRE